MWRPVIVSALAGAALAACGGGGVDIEEFERRWEARVDETFTITYEKETRSPLGTDIAEITWYRSPSTTFRLNERQDYAGEEGFLAYINGYPSYVCAGEPDERICEVQGCCRVLQPNYYFIQMARLSSTTVTGSRGDTIAGNKAECYEVDVGLDNPLPYSTYELCLAEDGLLLGGTTGPFESSDPNVQGMVVTMTATDVRREVAEDAFEPPYEVVGESELCETDAFEC